MQNFGVSLPTLRTGYQLFNLRSQEWELITQTSDASLNSNPRTQSLDSESHSQRNNGNSTPSVVSDFTPIEEKGPGWRIVAVNLSRTKKNCICTLSGNIFFLFCCWFSRREVSKRWVKIGKVTLASIVPPGLWWVSLHRVQSVDDRWLM